MQRAQVAIIGGGFAGASTAYFLGKMGVRDVVLLEREAICGAHASGRNAAMCRQLMEEDELMELAMRGASFLRKPDANVASSPLVTRCGSFLVASKESSLDELVARARAHDLAHEVVTKERLAERWPLLSGVPSVGAVYCPTDGIIDIHGLLQGYLGGAREAGVNVRTGCEVTSLASVDFGMNVVVNDESWFARVVVVAAGAWAQELGEKVGAPPLGLRPLRRHLFTTTAQDVVDRDASFVWHVDEPFYVRPESGSLLLSGCDEDVQPAGDAQPKEDATSWLAERLRMLAPGLCEIPIARVWACLRTLTASRLPVIDWDKELSSLFWVAGLGGHGATTSAAVGEKAASAIATRLT